MKTILLQLMLIISANAFSQQPLRGNCGTPTPHRALRFTAAQMNEAQRTIDYAYVVNIYVHILTDDNGSNAAATDSSVKADLQTMSNFFKPHNICFILLGIDYRSSTLINNMMNIDNSSHIATLTSGTNHANCIDIYVHQSFSDPNIAGNAYAIPSDFISVLGSTISRPTLAHEMGHALGLYHTFETAYGEECPDGSDCSGDGDLICDTPADFNGSQNMVATGTPCVYTGTQTVNCDIFPFSNYQAYDPSETNMMSYWGNCRNNFTPQQGLRMRVTLSNENIVKNCLTVYDAPVTTGNTDINITGEWYVSAKNEISILSTGTGRIRILGGVLDKWINAGTRIRIGPGSEIRPDASATRFVINPLCE
ncbi:MAG: M43 family zinc metalloprotease [Ferruginibacter sp.]